VKSQNHNTSDVPLDRSVLDELRELFGPSGKESVRQIIDAYLRGEEVYLKRMREARSTGDRDELKNAVHSLGGSAGTLGAEVVLRLCRELQGVLERDGWLEAWDEREAELLKAVSDARAAFKEYRREL